MFIIRIIVLTIIFFMVFNFSKVRSGKFEFNLQSLILPFSLSFALVLVDSFIRVAFFYAIIVFIVIASLCYFLLRKQGFEPDTFFKMEGKEELCQRLGFQTEDDMYAGIGSGNLSVVSVIGKMRTELKKANEPEPLIPDGEADLLLRIPEKKDPVAAGVRVKGIKDLAVHLSHCCNPLPGDQIIGYITRGRGVSVHRADCPNIAHHFRGETERIIEVSWDQETPATYQVEIEVNAFDRPNLATDIMTTIADTKTIINAVHARGMKNRMARVNLKIEIRNVEHLYRVMQKVNQVSDVLEVHRVVPN